MSDLRETEVLEIGREAAVRLLGDGKVEHIQVAAHPDTTGTPAYHFIIVVNQGADREKAWRARNAVGINIRDNLLRRGDESYPHIRFIDPTDWPRVRDA